MTEEPILITNLNDFEFCPLSIYYHASMGDVDRIMSQTRCQINGSNSHSAMRDDNETVQEL